MLELPIYLISVGGRQAKTHDHPLPTPHASQTSAPEIITKEIVTRLAKSNLSSP